jgi:putative DNA primase/helicase
LRRKPDRGEPRGLPAKDNGRETEYLVLPETFKPEVCGGFDYRMVARVLADRGFLDCQPPDLMKRVRLPGNLGLIRAFSVTASILEGGVCVRAVRIGRNRLGTR